MRKTNIAVLFGGCSTEYEVSLQSAASVMDHLDLGRYNVIQIGITRDGRWLRYNGSAEAIRSGNWLTHASCTPAFITPSREWKGIIELVNNEYRMLPIDVVLPVLHGRNGEDGSVQGLLELSGIPFVGCGTLSSAIGMDKQISHTLVRAAGIATADAITVYAAWDRELAIADAINMGFPVFVKPAKSGSSFGITKASNTQELLDGIELALAHDDKIVIERAIDGFEVGCAVLGNESLIVGEVDEIELADGFFNHHEKYSLETSRIHLPARIDRAEADRVQEAAQRVYRILECKGLARVDFFLTPDGQLLFNEVNTMPGFTAMSRYPNMLRATGFSYADIIDRMVELALEAGTGTSGAGQGGGENPEPLLYSREQGRTT